MRSRRDRKSIGRLLPLSAVGSLRPYRSVSQKARFLAPDGGLRLDWNESTLPPSPLVFERLAAFLERRGLNWYADPSASELRRRLAAFTRRPASQIQVFNGSDSALDYVARTFVGRGDHVLIDAPCYDNFRVFAAALGAEVESVLGRSPFTANASGLLARMRPNTRLVYICNPNNPTGRVYTRSHIRSLLDALGTGVLLLDEAYAEFAGATAAALLDDYEHLVIARSFSKAFALAGVRCGYVLASERILRRVNRLRNGKDVNALAQIAACAALEDLGHMRGYVAEVRRARGLLVRALRARGFQVFPSTANFILVKVEAPERLLDQLQTRGIYLRDRSYLPQLAGFVRVTVGTRDQSQRLVAVLDEIAAAQRDHRRASRG